MKPILKDSEFDAAALACAACGWAGTGIDTHIIDLYGLAKVREVHCPACDAYIAGVENPERLRGESADQISFQIG